MNRNDYIKKVIDFQTEPNDFDYLSYAISIAQVDNNIADEIRTSSIGGWEDGIAINETFYNENVSSENKPSWSDVNAVISELKTAYANKNYSRNRAYSYPTITKQLEMMYDDQINGTTTWKDAIQAVKDANPKA
jgi:hypothetical protein